MTIAETNFTMSTYEYLTHFISQLSTYHNVWDNIKQYFVQDTIQNTESDYCRIFQPYFYEKNFKIKLESNKEVQKLNKNTI